MSAKCIKKKLPHQCADQGRRFAFDIGGDINSHPSYKSYIVHSRQTDRTQGDNYKAIQCKNIQCVEIFVVES